MRPTRSNVASVLGMSDTFAAVIYHPAATGSETGSNLTSPGCSTHELLHYTYVVHSTLVASLDIRCDTPRAWNAAPLRPPVRACPAGPDSGD